MKNRFTLFLLLFTVVISSAQSKFTKIKDYPVQLLIPFNDHGKWGYADTSGTIRVKPHFKQTGSFNSIHVNNKRHTMADVTTKYGENLLTENMKLIFPKKSHILEITDFKKKRNSYKSFYLLEQKGKIGLMDLEGRVLVPMEYDSAFYIYNSLFFKKAEEMFYKEFNSMYETMIETDITSLQKNIYYPEDSHRSFPVLLAEDKRGNLSLIKFGNREDFPRDQLGQLQPFDKMKIPGEPDFVDASVYVLYSIKPASSLSSDLRSQVDEVIRVYDYSSSWFRNKYGFTQLILAKKNGKLGIIQEAGKEILSFQYDEIIMEERGTQAVLHKDGKKGIKLFLTHYPTIEPKYDSFEFARSLPVSSSWSFAVFKIELDGQIGYVGENGVEYFDFD